MAIRRQKILILRTLFRKSEVITKMTIQEFREKFYLHDSSIEKIFFDEKNKKISLIIEFCFWWQTWYDKNTPTNGKISVTFENVSFFEYDENISEKIFSDELDGEILNAELDENGIFVIFSVETSADEEFYWKLKINAANVEVLELERYNL